MDIYLTVIVINIEKKKKNYWNYTYLRKRYYIFKVGCKLKMVPFVLTNIILGDPGQIVGAIVGAILPSDWCQKTFVFFCPNRRQNGGDRLELVL